MLVWWYESYHMMHVDVVKVHRMYDDFYLFNNKHDKRFKRISILSYSYWLRWLERETKHKNMLLLKIIWWNVQIALEIFRHTRYFLLAAQTSLSGILPFSHNSIPASLIRFGLNSRSWEMFSGKRTLIE